MYCAPEIVNGSRYNTGVDVYSYAITVFECLCGREHARAQYRKVPSHAVCTGWRPRPTNTLAVKYPRAWALIQECWRSDKTEDKNNQGASQMLIQQGAERDASELLVDTAVLKRPTFTEIVERLASMRPALTCLPEHVSQPPQHLSAFADATPESPHVTLGSEELKAAQARYRNSPKGFACFLSHHKQAGTAEAEMVKQQLESTLEASVFLGKSPPPHPAHTTPDAV